MELVYAINCSKRLMGFVYISVSLIPKLWYRYKKQEKLIKGFQKWEVLLSG
jgi:hypothetical protein